MENTQFIGIVKLKGYPKEEIFEEFTERVDKQTLLNFTRELKSKIKIQYIKYVLYMLACSLITAGFFIAGYYTYETIFPLSVIFSLFFVAGFIYVSRAEEIKSDYFKFFKLMFLQEFSRCCFEGEKLHVEMKRKKYLIFLVNTKAQE